MTLVSTCKGVDHIPEESELKIDLKRTFGCKQAKGSSSLMWKGKYVKKFDFLNENLLEDFFVPRITDSSDI